MLQAHQHAVGQHRDRGVALGLGDQRFLAEGVAHAELGQLDAFRFSGVSRVTDARAVDDGVEVVALVALADDDVAGAMQAMRCMRMKMAWMFAGGMRWKARLCSSVVIQSSPSAPWLRLQVSHTS